jgi:hypothetical protein
MNCRAFGRGFFFGLTPKLGHSGSETGQAEQNPA